MNKLFGNIKYRIRPNRMFTRGYTFISLVLFGIWIEEI